MKKITSLIIFIVVCTTMAADCMDIITVHEDVYEKINSTEITKSEPQQKTADTPNVASLLNILSSATQASSSNTEFAAQLLSS